MGTPKIQTEETPSPEDVLLLLKHPVTVNDAFFNPNRKTFTLHTVHCLRRLSYDERFEQLKMPIMTWETIRAKSENIRRVFVQDAEHASNSKL